MMVVWSPSTRENNVDQSSGVEVKVLKNHAIWECKLNVSRIAGGHRIGWHWHDKLEIFHIRGHD
uniref:Uncharacterized protein n=1 Tax=Romanomermis culicivorax TaxID=13658 RepID=A0A915IBM6_ROMCU